MSAKVAVFVSGPVRFVTLVRQNVSLRLGTLDHDFLYHLWTDDLSNKPRTGFVTDSFTLGVDSRTKVLLFHRPYAPEDFRKSIGLHVNSHSSVNAVAGMFLGLAQLCAVFETLPDRRDYTHILRIRTDCVLTNPNFCELLPLARDEVAISTEPGVHHGWRSDHLLFAPADRFLEIFGWREIERFYEAFEAGTRNPEKTLCHLMETRLRAGTKTVETFMRYRDYQIVYSPPRPTEAPWMSALIEAGRFPELFLEPEKFSVENENEGILERQAARANLEDPYRSPLRNALRRLKRAILG